jgi:hypothetical protein
MQFNEESHVDIKIGILESPREVQLNSDEAPEAVTARITEAIASGALLSLSDDRGRTVLIPGSKIAYVELGAPSTRRVGFGASA